MLILGTEETSPSLWDQCYNFHGSDKGWHAMGCVALLKGKRYADYHLLFSEIKSLLESVLEPGEEFQRADRRCVLDCEAAAIKAVKAVWPGMGIDGCYFHYAQALVRAARESDIAITRHYIRSAGVRWFCNVLRVLPVFACGTPPATVVLPCSSSWSGRGSFPMSQGMQCNASKPISCTLGLALRRPDLFAFMSRCS